MSCLRVNDIVYVILCDGGISKESIKEVGHTTGGPVYKLKKRLLIWRKVFKTYDEALSHRQQQER